MRLRQPRPNRDFRSSNAPAVTSESPPPPVAGSRHNAAVAYRAALPLDVQNSYRERYRAMRPGWRTSNEQLEAMVRSYLAPGATVLDLGCGRGGVVELFWRGVKLAAGTHPHEPPSLVPRHPCLPDLTGPGDGPPFAGESF